MSLTVHLLLVFHVFIAVVVMVMVCGHRGIDPRCRLSTYSHRAFSIAGPTVWNSLPDELRDPACGSDSFKQFLKTILFSLFGCGLQC